MTLKNKQAIEQLRFLRDAADSGDVKAQMRLAERCEAGDALVERNLNQAFYWYAQAARQNNVDALGALAEFYQDGIVVERNMARADALIRQALDVAHGFCKRAFLEIGVGSVIGPGAGYWETVDGQRARASKKNFLKKPAA